MCNLVRPTSEWNKELLISIMSAYNTRRGQGTYSDTQNTLGVVKLRDLLGFGVGRDSRAGGRFGGPHSSDPGQCRVMLAAQAGTRSCAQPGDNQWMCKAESTPPVWGSPAGYRGWVWLPARAAEARGGRSRALTCSSPPWCASRRRSHKKSAELQ